MTYVLIQRGEFLDTETDICREKQCEDTSGECHEKTRDWSDASRSQGTTEATRSEGRGRTFPSAFTQLSPDDTLISDLWSPKLWDNAFCCLSYPICHTQPPLGPHPNLGYLGLDVRLVLFQKDSTVISVLCILLLLKFFLPPRLDF